MHRTLEPNKKRLEVLWCGGVMWCGMLLKLSPYHKTVILCSSIDEGTSLFFPAILILPYKLYIVGERQKYIHVS